MSRPRDVLRAAAALALVAVGALAMFAFGAATLFTTRRIQAEILARALGRAVLAACGIRLRIAGDPRRRGPAIHVSNHATMLDLPIVLALGFPRCRYFLSGYLRRNPPVGAIGALIGVFWTAPHDQTERRRRIFMRAERVLARTGDSVYMTPEGRRVREGGIGEFHRAAVHLATNLRVPIAPLFLEIPAACHPETGLAFARGTATVHALPPIDTAGWTEAEIDRHTADLRRLFVDFDATLRTGGIVPS